MKIGKRSLEPGSALGKKENKNGEKQEKYRWGKPAERGALGRGKGNVASSFPILVPYPKFCVMFQRSSEEVVTKLKDGG